MEKDALRLAIINLLEGELSAIGVELIDIRLFAGGGRLNVRVFVDRPGGIDLGGCAKASRTVGMLLEESGLIADAYVIEVSSPGVRRPLRTPAHFAAAVGERVELSVGRQGRSRAVRGLLLAAEPTGLRLRRCAVRPVPDGLDELSASTDDELPASTDDELPASMNDEMPASTNEDWREDASPVEGGGNAAQASPDAGEAEIVVAWDDVAAANLDPDFDMQALINADRRRHRDERRAQRQQARKAREARQARRRRPKPE